MIALTLAGSTRAKSTNPGQENPVPAEIQRLSMEGRRALADGRYIEARTIYHQAAETSAAANLLSREATYWNNAGAASIATRHFRDAMEEFRRARQTATQSHSWVALSYTMSNLTSLYLQMLNPEAAAATAREALAGPEGGAEPHTSIKIRFQLASALARLNRFDEALPKFRQAIFQMDQTDDIETSAAFWSAMGGDALEASRFDFAETAFTEALRLVRTHRLKNGATILRGLAKVKNHAGDYHSAAVLFDAALAESPGLTARWVILTDRGKFRLQQGDTAGALRDYREARGLVAALRADMVPADVDRVTLESGLGDVLDGLVNAGNVVAGNNRDIKLLAETFDAAEQDRMWSLRALIPGENDWRSRLPDKYWELLARYQKLQGAALAPGGSTRQAEAVKLSMQLADLEAAAAGGPDANPNPAAAAVQYVQNLLGADSILFSFHLGKLGAWVWAVEKDRVQAFSLGDSKEIERCAVAFTASVKEGRATVAESNAFYKRLFGAIPEARLRHRRWLLELDSALFSVPFTALVVEQGVRPVYLVERAAVQTVPGALLLKKGTVPSDGEFVGAGDAVYNTADPRYRGPRNARRSISLPRLPNTAGELESCSREWGAGKSRILTGTEASMENLRAAMAESPSVLHLATHVVPSSGDYRTGLIAMSLDETGAMGLVGPREILARPVKAALVVMNGCHSAQGETLPGTGLMGLTRAWIGAGAGAVLATQWDISDDAAQAFMTAFYRALKTTAAWDPSVALRQAQLESLQGTGTMRSSVKWAGYFLMSRFV